MRSRTAIAIISIMVLSTLTSVHVRAPVNVNGVSTIISDYVNGSKAVAGALLNFTGSPPSKLSKVTFQWFDPAGSLVYAVSSDPDDNGLARSNLTVNQTGTWWVNASYDQPPDIFYHNTSFRVMENHWDSSFRVIDSDLIVGEGATLTIEAGAIIAFDPQTRFSVIGTLIARGMWNSGITFTSNSSSPMKGDWDGIYFYSGSNDSVLDFDTVEYSGHGFYVENSSPSIENCTLLNNTNGIKLFGSSSRIFNSTIKDSVNGLYAIASNPTLISNVAMGNVVGFRIEGSGKLVSRMNRADGNEQTGFRFDYTTVESYGDVSSGGLVGMRLYSSQGRIEDASISATSDGVYSYHGNAVLLNSTISGGLRDFFLEGDSSLTTVNSSFSGKVSAGSDCGDCYLFVKNYLTIKAVVHETYEPVADAQVQIHDGDVLVFSGFTDSRGYIENITLAYETYHNSAKQTNVTMVLVSHPTLSFAYSNRTVSMNTSHTEIFEGSTVDSDGDGEPDFSDLDDDNDGLNDDIETTIGTDPLSEDTDGDTMPDAWEYFNGLDPTNSSDADLDLDGDGFTNLEEYQNGPDPDNPLSHPQITEQHPETHSILDDLILCAGVLLLIVAVALMAVIVVRRRRE